MCLVRSPSFRLDPESYHPWCLHPAFVGTPTAGNVDEELTSASLSWEALAGPGLHTVQLSASDDLHYKAHGDDQTWDGMNTLGCAELKLGANIHDRLQKDIL